MARPLKNLPRKTIIQQIRRINTRNYRMQMSLFDLAIAAKPKKAKAIIQKIVANNMQVSKWMGRI